MERDAPGANQANLESFERRLNDLGQRVDQQSKWQYRSLLVGVLGGVIGGLLPTFVAFKTAFPSAEFEVIGAAPLDIQRSEGGSGVQIAHKISVLNKGNGPGVIELTVYLEAHSPGTSQAPTPVRLRVPLIQKVGESGKTGFPISVGAYGNSDYVMTVDLSETTYQTLPTGQYALVFRMKDAENNLNAVCFDIKDEDVSRLEKDGNLVLTNVPACSALHIKSVRQ